jgi:G3E family GTPase
VKVVIVYGFLGAGKTTLIRHLLATVVEPGRVAVLVNEFGRANVDGAVLAGQHLKVLPLASGCLCCTLSGAFTPALEELHREFDPEWLVIEPTGVAAPYAMEALIRDTRLKQIAALRRVATVVDASRFLKYLPKLGEFYPAQVAQADLIVLNKADLVAPEELAAARAALREINAAAELRVTQYAQVDWQLVLSDAPTRAGAGRHLHGPEVQACSVALGRVTRAQLAQLFAAMRAGALGNVLRAKGIAEVDGERTLINYIAGDWALQATSAAPTDLAVIGQGLAIETLENWTFAEQAVAEGRPE